MTHEQADVIPQAVEASEIASADTPGIVPDYASPSSPTPESLRSKAVIGAGWSAIGMAGNSVLSLGSSLVLTRLLVPEAFGMMATISVLTVALEMFSDIGLMQGIIQHSKGEDRTYLDTAWSLQVIRGFILTGAMLLFAYPFAWFYKAPALFPMMLALALSFVLRGFNSPGLFLLRKRLHLGRLVIMDLSCNGIRVAATIAAAFVRRDVWALVMGGLLGNACLLAASFLVLPYRPRFRPDRQAARDLARFGGFILVSGIVGFLCNRLDSTLIPKYLGMDSAGVYYIAVTISGMLMNLLFNVFDQTLYPAFCRLKDDLERLRARQHELLEIYCCLVVPLLLAVAANGNLVVTILYDPRYQAAGTALGWLVLVAVVEGLGRLLNIPIMASGRSHVGTIAAFGYLIGLCITLPTLAPRWGIPGYATAKFLASLGLLIPLIRFSGKYGHRTFQETLRHLRVPAVTSIALVLVHGLVARQDGGVAAAVIRAGLDAILLAAIWFIWQRELVATSLRELARVAPEVVRRLKALLPKAEPTAAR